MQYSTREYTLQYKKRCNTVQERHNTAQEKKQLGTRKNVVLKCLNNQSIGLLILRKLYIFIKIKIYIFIKLKFIKKRQCTCGYTVFLQYKCSSHFCREITIENNFSIL